jgi:hypothetical protein
MRKATDGNLYRSWLFALLMKNDLRLLSSVTTITTISVIRVIISFRVFLIP